MRKPFCLGAVLASLGLVTADTVSLRKFRDDGKALQWVENNSQDIVSLEPNEFEWLIGMGWWSTARGVIAATHRHGAQKQTAALATVTRRKVGDVKQQCDALLASLNVQKEVGSIQCSFQWAQNSTAIFLSIKFAHRWTSPGALEVENKKVSLTDCCFNFTGDGTHSGLKKRYFLDLEFTKEVDKKRWSWELAAAGRLTAIIGKKERGKWPHLLKGKKKLKQMSEWESMNEKWSKEVRDFEQRKKKGNVSTSTDPDVLAVEDEMYKEEEEASCSVNKQSPFRYERQVVDLCKEYFPPRRKKERNNKWIVLYYSPKEMKCEERNKQCMDIKAFWTHADKTLRKDRNEARFGAVDCDINDDFCKAEEVGHMPFIRRYYKGKRKTYYDAHEVEPLYSFLNS